MHLIPKTILILFGLFLLVGQRPSDLKGEETLPNIIYIWIDTLRADGLGFYGNERELSPNLDQLAEESIVFMNQHTPHTVTLSSFSSIITGLYPFSHGVLNISKDKLPIQVKTFAQVLKMHGYQTSWFGPLEDPHLDPEVGFGWGFDKIDEFDSNFGLAFGTDKILQEIERLKDQRFFINFHTYFVHAPYIPSEEYRFAFTEKKDYGVIESWEGIEAATVRNIKQAIETEDGMAYWILEKELADEMREADLFTDDYRTSARKIQDYLLERNLFHRYNNIFSLSYQNSIDQSNPEVLEYVRALYDATVLEFDQEVIGPLVERLKEMGLYDKTMIIVCSDHGEEFGEHGELGHGRSLYQEVTHVPFFFKPAGDHVHQKIYERSQTVDIMPTILDLIGIRIPHQIDGQGKNFAPLIRNEAGFEPRKYLYGQMNYHESISSDDWKLHIFRGYHELPWFGEAINIAIFGKRELFNVKNDPTEQINLLKKQQLVGKSLTKELREWKDSLRRFQTEVYEFQPNIDEQTKDRIKKTGYW
ncbi:MAG: DUF229 domain-containing protein [Desulfobulbaceae bacterium]|nr:MAG: DUF229 domain-containing protein [Desulfobulbaceae bacterium]